MTRLTQRASGGLDEIDETHVAPKTRKVEQKHFQYFLRIGIAGSTVVLYG